MEMKKNVKQLGGLLLVLTASLLTAASCGKAGGTESQTQAAAPLDTAPTAETESIIETYPGEIKDFGQYEFRILNLVDNMWDSPTMILDPDASSGDKLDTAILQTIRAAEEEWNIRVTIPMKLDIFELSGQINKIAAAGEDAYDAAYFLSSAYMSVCGSVLNLYDIPEIQLAQPWWSPSYIESMTISDAYLFAAPDYLNMFTEDCATGLFFNRKMMLDNGLDLPYDIIRSGKWTFDRMNEYMKAVVNLNGDTSFTPKVDGICTYGYIGNHNESALTLMEGGNGFLIEKDADNLPVLKENLTGFVDLYQKMSSIFGQDGCYELINTAELTGFRVFIQGRSMFYSGAAGGAIYDYFRESSTEYGIIPLPKADENQKSYISPLSQYGMLVSVPKTVSDPSRTGMILDYLSWKGYHTIYPVFQEYLCYKGMRDEDSIEMLSMIFDSKTADIGFLWNITQSIQNSLADGIRKTDSDVVSKIEKQKKTIEKALQNCIDIME